MFVLKMILVWALVSVHVVGAAFLFRRVFPRESRWLAFIVPEIVLVLLCNFVEHHLALTQIRLLLPFTTAVSVAAIVLPKNHWCTMRLPTMLFLGAFLFTFGLRVLRPNIADAQDGISDLSLIADFLYGQTLPAESTWLAPIKLMNYYCLEHYGASVLIRLLGVEIGTGFNLSVALLSAYILFITASIAWHLSRGKLWVVILSVLLTACAATGQAGYLWLTVKDLFPDNITNPYGLLDLNPAPKNPYLRQLSPLGIYDRHILMPPGFGAWNGCFHSAQTGQMLIGLSLLALIEALRVRRANWPWICLALAPFLMLTTCTWGVPLVAFLLTAGLIAVLRLKVRPKNPAVTFAVSAGLIVLLEPMLIYFLEALPDADFTWNEGHTQLPEFALQWWPIYLPWFLLFFVWDKLHPVTRVVILLTPLSLLGTETWSLGLRSDTTGKLWAIIFAAAWMIFLPEICRQRTWPFRLTLLLLIAGSVLSLGFWVSYYNRVVSKQEITHIDGLGQFRSDRRKARILEIVSHFKSETILPGLPSWACAESALLPLLSHTRAYLAWTNFCDYAFYTNGIDEGVRREFAVNKLYAGILPDPVTYLRQRSISAVVLYPDDNLDPSLVVKLKQQLQPYYTYEDANFRSPSELDQDISLERPAAGVFVYHPEITRLLGLPTTSK